MPQGESSGRGFLRRWRSRGSRVTPTPEDIDKVTDVLAALEYGKPKEETDLIQPLFARFGISRRPTKVEIAPVIAATPGFEPFFLAVLDGVRPFAAMLTEVYEFLGRHGTVGRRASVFSVRTAAAEAVLDFSLANFPRQLLRLLVAGEVDEATIKLTLPDDAAAAAASVDDFSLTQLSDIWTPLHGNRDNDEFYDIYNSTGFFRLVSLASFWRHRTDADTWRSVAAVVEPVIDRLAALLEAFETSGVNVSPDGTSVPLRGMNGPVQIRTHRARSHAVDRLPTPAQLNTRLPDNSPIGRVTTLGDEFSGLAHDWAIIVHLWRTPELVRADGDLDRRLPGDPLAGPATFADALTRAASTFRGRLDAAAPIVASGSRKVELEQLIEFTELPFWKHRWFLYELWTLVRVLRVAATVGDVRLEGLTETRPGVTEWLLPGGAARSPVARVVKQSRSASVWTQLKSQHPATGAGLEPDLRIRSDDPDKRDIFLIENKDRLSLGGGEITEIVERYVTGTTARAAWFVNYEEFPPSASTLERLYPGRNVRVVSHFRPLGMPSDFEGVLAGILREHLDRPALPRIFEVALTWTAPPADLDLHAWIERGQKRHHVFFEAPGAIDSVPFAVLDGDRRSGGTETITITDTQFDRLVIAVHNFTGEGTISDGKPIVTLRADGESLGEQGARNRPGRWWWTVLEIDSTGHHRWVESVSYTPPFD